jgi:ABC-2 type transport system permease protein
MRYSRIAALTRKEWIQVVRDPSSIFVAFVLPFFLLLLFGSGISLDINHLKIGVVLEDRSPLAREMVTSLQNSKYLDVSITTQRSTMEHMLRSGDVKGYIVVPTYFSKRYLGGVNEAPVQIIVDGSDPNTAQFVKQYVRAALTQWDAQALGAKPLISPSPILVKPRTWYNEDQKTTYSLLPGSIVIIMTVAGSLLTALVVAKEWERGTMEALMATPVTMGEILFSKFAAYFSLGLGTLALCFVATHFIYLVPFQGSALALALSSISFLSFTLLVGLLISTITKSQFAAIQATIVVTFLPATLLSGLIFDIDSMPLPLQLVTRLLAARYYVENQKTQFLVGDVWSQLAPNIAILLLMTLVLAGAVYRRSGKRLDD